VLNKIDLVKEDDAVTKLKEQNPEALFLSVSEEIGINSLEEKIYRYASGNRQDIDNQVLITNARHENQLRKAKNFIESAYNAVNKGLTLDMVALDLKSALEELGRITGHHADEDVVNAIFSRFCLGK
jgi:tRNA modification GTPase